MKEKTMVLLEFTGKVDGKVFDTTSEKTARENSLHKENAVYKPVPVIIGNKDVLLGIDEALLEMGEGEEKKIAIAPEKAFGNRKKELIVVIPTQEFKKRKLQPFPGLIVDLNGSYGRVQTVSGGRVRVDLNNDLAGKEVEYELKILKEVKEPKEKAQLLTEKFFPVKGGVETKLENGVLTIKLPKEIGKQIGPLLAPFTKTMKEAVPEITKVEVEDVKEKEPTKKEKEAEHVHADDTVHEGHHEH